MWSPVPRWAVQIQWTTGSRCTVHSHRRQPRKSLPPLLTWTLWTVRKMFRLREYTKVIVQVDITTANKAILIIVQTASSRVRRSRWRKTVSTPRQHPLDIPASQSVAFWAAMSPKRNILYILRYHCCPITHPKICTTLQLLAGKIEFCFI